MTIARHTGLTVVGVGLAAALATPAHAAVGGAYGGTTDTGRNVSFKVRAQAPKLVRGFAIGYTARCTDGERLRSTFRFYPTPLKAAARFAVVGSSAGTLADGRAFTSKVKLSGRFQSSGSALGTFRLVTRIPGASGALATCTTGLVRWTAKRD